MTTPTSTSHTPSGMLSGGQGESLVDRSKRLLEVAEKEKSSLSLSESEIFLNQLNLELTVRLPRVLWPPDGQVAWSMNYE